MLEFGRAWPEPGPAGAEMAETAAGLARSVRGGLIAAALDAAHFSRHGGSADAPPRPAPHRRLIRELRRAGRDLLRLFTHRDAA
jgi:hypothetical protein